MASALSVVRNACCVSPFLMAGDPELVKKKMESLLQVYLQTSLVNNQTFVTSTMLSRIYVVSLRIKVKWSVDSP
jgi:hypothetical protein